MRLELDNNKKQFINAMKTTNNIVQDVKLTFTNKGLTIQAIDESHICFIKTFLDIEFFDEYTTTDEEIINIDLGEFVKILNMVDKDDRIFLESDNNLKVIFEGESKRVFHIKLLDDELKSVTPPQQTYPSCFELPYSLFKDNLKNAQKLDSRIDLIVDEDYFKLKTDGQFSDMRLEYLHGEKVTGTYKSRFSLDKLLNCLSNEFSSVVKVSLGDDKPVCLRLENNLSYLSFIIAPRIEGD